IPIERPIQVLRYFPRRLRRTLLRRQTHLGKDPTLGGTGTRFEVQALEHPALDGRSFGSPQPLADLPPHRSLGLIDHRIEQLPRALFELLQRVRKPLNNPLPHPPELLTDALAQFPGLGEEPPADPHPLAPLHPSLGRRLGALDLLAPIRLDALQYRLPILPPGLLRKLAPLAHRHPLRRHFLARDDAYLGDHQLPSLSPLQPLLPLPLTALRPRAPRLDPAHRRPPVQRRLPVPDALGRQTPVIHSRLHPRMLQRQV